MALTKAELAQALEDELGLNGREAKEFVNLFFEEIRAQLERGIAVKLSGFGFNLPAHLDGHSDMPWVRGDRVHGR